MVRIDSLPDLSRFVQRTDKVPVYNTIHLLVGEESVEVSGPVICQASKVLEGLVGNQPELYLDQFTGEIEGIYDVVEVLYGGDVELSEGNYQTLLKFSIVYDVKKMYNLCFEWLKGHIATLDLFSLIQFGLLIQRLADNGKRDILDICSGFIRDELKDELHKLSKTKNWKISDEFVKFLIEEDILYYTLPVLSDWISANGSDAHINMILTELEDKDIIKSFWKNGQRSSDFFEKISHAICVFETLKRVNVILNDNFRNSISTGLVKRHCLQFSDLITEDYYLFQVEKVMGLEEQYSLTHFQFVEVVLQWITSNTPSQDDVSKLWALVRQVDLSYNFVNDSRNTVLCYKEQYLSIPDIDNRLEHNDYKYWYSCQQLQKPSDLPTVIKNMDCKKCKRTFDFKVRLLDRNPCYEVEIDDPHASHITVEHVWLSFSHYSNNYVIISLLTNSYSSVIEKVKSSGSAVSLLDFMYTCNTE